ncbi:DUF2225 domain-containing protein [Metabacillus malikii]|uniref:Uncharacterized protein (DUF2225 family) n=1 Tax=Metabacillus malikii TaxID=1504265 RepID=A0ABT9ZBT8_9BACI|nr:DUF2225 domain-containing protein [Metabacillus malikii]MDQ0229736.1 uncharacterized protein (DUF2225 family) [Metabacillus malikii]
MSRDQDYLYEKSVQCSVCHETYGTKKVLSKFIRIQKHDTDFCSYYTKTEINPLLYYVNVCPNCGFSTSDEFSNFFPPATLSDIQEKITNNWRKLNYCAERTVDKAINTYKLAIYCGTLKKEKNIAMAGLYLRLAWLYRTEKINLEEEHRFLRLGLDQYIQSYMNGDFADTQLTEVKLLYIIGDLSRRLGMVEQATRYFSRVIEMQKETFEKGIVQMAKDRWADMREEKKLG